MQSFIKRFIVFCYLGGVAFLSYRSLRHLFSPMLNPPSAAPSSQDITVVVQKLTNTHVEQRLNLSSSLQACKEYPQCAAFRGIVHKISVKIGDTVRQNQNIYNIQQINPGQEFLNSWVKSFNAGVVVALHVVPGAEVQQNAPIVTVADLSCFKAILSVQAQYAHLLTPGMPVYAINHGKIEDYGGGRISKISLIANSQSHLFDIEVTIPYSANLYVGKMQNFALFVQPFDGIVISQDAIIQRNGQPTVTLVKNNKIVYQPVVLGMLYQQNYAILSGLTEGDLQVLSSNHHYQEGDTVHYQEQPLQPTLTQ